MQAIRYFEHHGQTIQNNKTVHHDKFYKIKLEQVNGIWVVETWRGRCGKQGRLIPFGYPTQEQALDKIGYLAYAKARKGYQEVSI
ncbi:MAG: WGR domain-containing protein [SAR324 cluster bacterium]|nr:WGR domain-containing protein [SAR324 cluster bacterium]